MHKILSKVCLDFEIQIHPYVHQHIQAKHKGNNVLGGLSRD